MDGNRIWCGVLGVWIGVGMNCESRVFVDVKVIYDYSRRV